MLKTQVKIITSYGEETTNVETILKRSHAVLLAHLPKEKDTRDGTTFVIEVGHDAHEWPLGGKAYVQATTTILENASLFYIDSDDGTLSIAIK